MSKADTKTPAQLLFSAVNKLAVLESRLEAVLSSGRPGNPEQIREQIKEAKRAVWELATVDEILPEGVTVETPLSPGTYILY